MQASIQHYAQAWYQALKESDQKDHPQISQTMLKKLQMEGKLSWLSGITSRVKMLEDEENGVTQVSIRTAHNASFEEIEPLLKELLGASDIQAEMKKDADLLGGIVVQTSDQRWDLSMKRQIEKLNEQLKF